MIKMMRNIVLFFVLFHLLDNSGARRLARTIETATGDTTDESSTEFSEDDLKKLKIELEKQLPSPYVERISGVLAKFTKDNPIELRMEGVFELLGLLVEGALAQVKLKHITNTTTTAMNETDDNWTTTPITPHDSVINTNTI